MCSCSYDHQIQCLMHIVVFWCLEEIITLPGIYLSWSFMIRCTRYIWGALKHHNNDCKTKILSLQKKEEK